MKRFKKILYVADTDLPCQEAFLKAITLAENNQAELTVVSIIDEIPDGIFQGIHDVSETELNAAIKNTKMGQLEQLVSSFQKTLEINFEIKIKILNGRAFLSIIQEVLKKNIDLVIKTVDEEKFMDRFLGSSDMHLLRKCPCPVWLLKPSQRGHFKRIMAAVDFEPFTPVPEDESLNQQIMHLSLSLALSECSEWHIIHVWNAYGETTLRSGLAKQPEADVDDYVETIRLKHQHKLHELVEKVMDDAGKDISEYIEPQLHLVKGAPKEKIPELAKKLQVDLIIMGTIGRTGLPGFIMGNTSETILNQIDCSVLAVKPEGFVSPVKI